MNKKKKKVRNSLFIGGYGFFNNSGGGSRYGIAGSSYDRLLPPGSAKNSFYKRKDG